MCAELKAIRAELHVLVDAAVDELEAAGPAQCHALQRTLVRAAAPCAAFIPIPPRSKCWIALVCDTSMQGTQREALVSPPLQVAALETAVERITATTHDAA